MGQRWNLEKNAQESSIAGTKSNLLPIPLSQKSKLIQYLEFNLICFREFIAKEKRKDSSHTEEKLKSRSEIREV